MTTESKISPLKEQIKLLEPYLRRILESDNPYDKLSVMDEHPLVQEYLRNPKESYPGLPTNIPEYDLVIRSIIAIGQGPIVFNKGDHPVSDEKVRFLLHTLVEIEIFYEAIGGILGYHYTVLKLICESTEGHSVQGNIRYIKPEGVHLSEDTPEVRRLIREGIEHLPELAEIYPVGGSGDRLDLHDDETGEALPAARLSFCGRTLLEGMIRDLQSREFLYYKLYDKQLEIPVAMMTSQEKNNHQHIMAICAENEQFGRHWHSFLFFIQPLSPVITIEGNWSLWAPFALMLKPGGHGVIWKLAIEQEIFSALEGKGKSKALVRQINNPIAAMDTTILSFLGMGFLKDKAFGFASCARLLNTAEGMNVLLERKNGEKDYSDWISNVEYTEFSKHGLKDIPAKEDSHYSVFPANTNILFVDLKSIRKAIESCPFPGKNINMKHKVPYLSPEGVQSCIEGGRLETTMQNITDGLRDHFDHPLKPEEQNSLRTYITYHERRKTISATKTSYVKGAKLVETPEGCFRDLLLNYRDLLVNYCKMELPELNQEADYIAHGPSFLVLLHPSLGPLFSVMSQKIQEGKLESGSELQLEIAEVDIRNLHLKGSLRINADAIEGKKNGEGILIYSEETGKCELHNVTVDNAGINRTEKNIFWKNWIHHQEVLSIIIRGNGEFYAENVIFKGRQHIEVPNGHRMTAYQQGDKVLFRMEKIDSPTWYWKYGWDHEDRIILDKVK